MGHILIISWERSELLFLGICLFCMWKYDSESVSHSVMSNSVAPWTVARQAPLSMGIFQARILEWVTVPSSRGSSQSRDRIPAWAGRFFTTSTTGQKCLNGDLGNPVRRRDSETRKWGKEILSHTQRSPAGSSAHGRGGGSRLELCRRWKRELKQGPPTSRIECLMNWGGADEIIEISVWSLSHVQHFVTLLTVATRLLSPLNSSGKNTGVGCHFLLQEIFSTQGLNLGLPHCR